MEIGAQAASSLVGHVEGLKGIAAFSGCWKCNG